MALISLISIVWKNYKLPTPPPKFGSPVFQVSMEMEYQHWPLSTFQHLCVAILKTFMRGLPNESPMCSFTLPDI